MTLLEAWICLPLGLVPLKVRGEGPISWRFQQTDPELAIELIARLEYTKLTALMQGARFLVWPSEGYYETFGLVAIEAFSSGLPVIASRAGVMAEIVEHQRTGLHFEPGNAKSLAAVVEWAWTHPQQMAAMGANARAEYEAKYTTERNYQLLMAIYGRAAGLPPSESRPHINTQAMDEVLIPNA